MSDLHNPRVATGKLVTLGNQKRWVEAIQLLGHHWKKSRLNMITLPETNIAPKNGWLEYYFPIGEAYSQGHVSFREGRWWFQILCSPRSLGR